jgi:hypothetical protein
MDTGLTGTRPSPPGQIAPGIDAELPEADVLDQQRGIDPEPLTHLPVRLDPAEPGQAATEADWLDQQAPVPSGDEEDYPRDSLAAD